MLKNILPKTRLWEHSRGTIKGDTINVISSFFNYVKDETLALYRIVPGTNSYRLDAWKKFFNRTEISQLKDVFSSRLLTREALRSLTATYSASTIDVSTYEPFRAGDRVGGNVQHKYYGYFIKIKSDVPVENRQQFERAVVRRIGLFYKVRFEYV